MSLFEHVKSYTSTSSNCLDVLSFIISLVLFECNQKSTIGIFYPNYPVISDMDEWKTEIRTNGGAVQDYTISYQNLDPLTTYYFRVIAYNEFGISEPCTTDETVRWSLCQTYLGGKLKILQNYFAICKKSSKFGLKFFVVSRFTEQITFITGWNGFGLLVASLLTNFSCQATMEKFA